MRTAILVYLIIGELLWCVGELILHPTCNALLRSHSRLVIIAATTVLIAVWPLVIFTPVVCAIRLASQAKSPDRSD